MNPKLLFCSNKDLREKLLAVTKQQWFLDALVYIMAEFVDSKVISPESLKGAQDFKETLLTIGDEDEKDISTYPQSGLIHDLEPKHETTPRTNPS